MKTPALYGNVLKNFPRIQADSIRQAIPQESTAYTALAQTVTNSTTLVNVNNLSVPLAANIVYLIRGLLPITALTAANNIKIGFNGGTATFNGAVNGIITFADGTAGDSLVGGGAISLITGISGGTTSVWTVVQFELIVSVLTSGTFQPQFAQVAAAATNTTIGAMAYMIAQPLDPLITQ